MGRLRFIEAKRVVHVNFTEGGHPAFRSTWEGARCRVRQCPHLLRGKAL